MCNIEKLGMGLGTKLRITTFSDYYHLVMQFSIHKYSTTILLFVCSVSQYFLNMQDTSTLEDYQMLLELLIYEVDVAQEPPCPLLRMIQVSVFSGE